MSMKDWAEREVEIACKKENPDWDGKSFDYGCSCYQSALKAYKALLKGGHSDLSWSVTKSILDRLMEGKPLTPITDEDFVVNEDTILESPEYLEKMGLKSDIQCPRMASLFRKEYLDGTVKYSDVDRIRCIQIKDGHKSVWHNGFINKMIDEMYPITMPYTGKDRYEVYVEEFLVDEKNGDFDTMGVIYVKRVTSPDIDITMINRYFKATEEGWEEISLREYHKRAKASKKREKTK